MFLHFNTRLDICITQLVSFDEVKSGYSLLYDQLIERGCEEVGSFITATLIPLLESDSSQKQMTCGIPQLSGFCQC